MRKNIYRILLLLILTLFTVTISGCDGKKPEKGYVSAAYIYVNHIYNFGDPGYTQYDCEGYFNNISLATCSRVPVFAAIYNVSLIFLVVGAKPAPNVDVLDNFPTCIFISLIPYLHIYIRTKRKKFVSIENYY